MRTSVSFMVVLLVALGTAIGAEKAPTFHGIKLGVSLGSQFQECPWNASKEGDIPKYISPPEKDDKGNSIPCFHGFDEKYFKAATYPQVASSIQLFEKFTLLKDAQGNVMTFEPQLLSSPTVSMQLLVPASASLRDGTVEEVMLLYLALESDRVRDALIKKFGTSHSTPLQMTPQMYEYVTGDKLMSAEAWETDWGEVHLVISNKGAGVTALTSKMKQFEHGNKKDEF